MKHPILEKDIELVATSEEFLEMARENNFHNLGEILEIRVDDLLKKPLFNYRMLSELGSILQSYGLLELLKDD
jgi:DNA-directed RNA polymerase alpha subunit